jgi:hypothetical protein
VRGAAAGPRAPDSFTGHDDAGAWLDAEQGSLIAAVRIGETTGDDQAAVRLPLILGYYLDWRRRPGDAIIACQEAVALSLEAGVEGAKAAALASL